MNYEEALNKWGYEKLRVRYPESKFLEHGVSVEMNFNEGFPCCGGTDPDCYCSFYESPSANVLISAMSLTGKRCVVTISHDEFDFVTVLGEILAAGGGTLTSEQEDESH